MKEPHFTRSILLATELPKRNLLKMLRETKLGESRMEDISIALLAKEMGFDEPPSFKEKRGKPTSAPSEAGKKVPKRTPVARRGPSRDPVGGENQ